MIRIKKVVGMTHARRNFKRYIEIFHVFFKYGFGGFFHVLGVNSTLKIICRTVHRKCKDERSEVITDLPIEVRMRMALEELGPTFIKLGQILSTRPDLIPAEFATEFSKLQDNAPYFSIEEACEIIQQELGAKAADIFDDFNYEPLAAASIGQVYRAVYRGEEVVVKVQRPNIHKIIEIDLEIMLHIALILERHVEEIASFKPSTIIEEFTKSLEREIDFKIEAKETKRFKENIKDNPNIYAPRVYDVLTTSRVMVAEYIDGIKPENIEALNKGDFDKSLLAENSVDSVLKQIFDYGFFHADPHPGNILIMPGNIVCFIDFGMVGKVSPKQKEYFASLILNILNKKSGKIVDILFKLTHYDEEPDRDTLERELFIIIDEYLLYSLKDIDFGKFLSELMDVFARFNLRLKAEIFMLLKALVSLEKTGRILAPEVNIIEKANPYVKKIYMERFNVKRILTNLVDPVSDTMILGSELPDDLRVITKNIRAGKFKFDINYLGLDLLRKTINRVSNKISLAIVLAALIIGHSMILAQPPSNVAHFMKNFGRLGFILTVIIAFCFLLSFFRKKERNQ
ncbi:MAG: AarF/ABC1/UbiB kinase family protein [Victivallales bacterium]|nr:AarF/ABC1/UbiB kinase family protein [Victivallales bacterium]